MNQVIAPDSHSRRAFTLVELLVVIGVIAVLISMLMPTVNRAREAARRTMCLSNLHQLGVAMTLYATSNSGSVPTGYWNGMKQFNYLINYNQNDSGWRTYSTGMGLLWDAKVLADGKAFYCPTENLSQLIYNSRETGNYNPWPPVKTDLGFAAHTRIGYGSRPTVGWPFVTGAGVRPTGYPTRMDRITRFKSEAVAADIVSTSTHITRRHGTGVNVLYGDASASWVPRKVFQTKLSQVIGTDFTVNIVWNNKVMLDESVIPAEGVWTKLDR